MKREEMQSLMSVFTLFSDQVRTIVDGSASLLSSLPLSTDVADLVHPSELLDGVRANTPIHLHCLTPSLFQEFCDIHNVNITPIDKSNTITPSRRILYTHSPNTGDPRIPIHPPTPPSTTLSGTISAPRRTNQVASRPTGGQ